MTGPVSQPRRPVILSVDDDPAVSRAVARDLRRHYGEAYRIVRAESGPDALDALTELKLRGETAAVFVAERSVELPLDLCRGRPRHRLVEADLGLGRRRRGVGVTAGRDRLAE